MANPTDPTDLFRTLFGEWQRLTAGQGQDGAPTAIRQMTERAMGAANVPTKSDIDALSDRIGRVEAALFRIEAAIGERATARATSDPPPEPTP